MSWFSDAAFVHAGKQQKEYKPRDLLDLTISNTSYIFDICAQYEKNKDKQKQGSKKNQKEEVDKGI